MRGITVAISLIGPVAVNRRDGQDATPNLQRARAILAILCLSPNRCRARSILQDFLWSDRSEPQASASLRNALAQIRSALGPDRDILKASRELVWLDDSALWIDVEDDSTLAKLSRLEHRRPRFLEGLELRSAEFEDWLRDQRSWFDARLERLDRSDVVASPAVVSPEESPEPWAYLRIDPEPEHRAAQVVARTLGETVLHTLSDTASVRFVESARRGNGAELRVSVEPLVDTFIVQMSLFAMPDANPIWSAAQSLSISEAYFCETTSLQWLANCAVENAKKHFQRSRLANDLASAFSLGHRAVDEMFLSPAKQVGSAEELLCQAEGISGAAIYTAWRAYLRSFYVGELGEARSSAVAEEAEDLVHRALTGGSMNSTVLALLSHVQAFVLQRPELGHELARQAVRISPSDPLAQCYLGRSKLYLGDTEGGYTAAQRARAIVGAAAYRHKVDYVCGIAALATGRLDEAVALGELVSVTMPNYRAPQRYLVPLYLHLGRKEDARRAFKRLRRIEPDFSLAKLGDPSYPVQGLREAGLDRFDDTDL